MYKFLDEIRDLLETNLIVSNTAEASTDSTTVKITNHGLSNGDVIVNQTRGNARRAVTVVDTNTLTVSSVTNQTSGDIIIFPKFKYFYVGKVHNSPINYLPVLMVYGSSTTLETKATNKDTYRFQVTIEILTNGFNSINASNDVELTKDLQAQKDIWQKMEERDNNGIPIASSILGVLRRNIRGSNYLFNNDIEINYETENIDNTVYYRGIMTLSLVTNLNLRQ